MMPSKLRNQSDVAMNFAVRMTLSVMTDMWKFLIIMVVLVVGNVRRYKLLSIADKTASIIECVCLYAQAFVLMLLYPQGLEETGSGSTGWQLDGADAAKVNELFGDVPSALFASTNMLFFGVRESIKNHPYANQQQRQSCKDLERSQELNWCCCCVSRTLIC